MTDNGLMADIGLGLPFSTSLFDSMFASKHLPDFVPTRSLIMLKMVKFTPLTEQNGREGGRNDIQPQDDNNNNKMMSADFAALR